MFRRLALLAVALCAFVALQGCGGTSSLMGPGTESSPVRTDDRHFGGGQREDDPRDPGADPVPVHVDQADTLKLAETR